jgi:hypothetical protein
MKAERQKEEREDLFRKSGAEYIKAISDWSTSDISKKPTKSG